MAVTKIWPIKDSIERVVDYAKNPAKTEFSDIQQVLHYAANEAKTMDVTERQLYVSGVNCNAATAFQEMLAVQQRFDKTTGNVAYHAYQSFKTGEVTPEQCHRLGVELARKMWGDQYQVLVATHFNTGTYPNHFVVNAVGMWDGKKFDCNKGAYWKFRGISDDLCREEGLTVIKNPIGQTPRKLYFAEKNGDPTRHNLMRQAIDHAISISVNPQNFINVMKRQGYLVDMNPRRKYAVIRSFNSKKATRLYRLGEDYDASAILAQLHENASKRYMETMMHYCQFMGIKPMHTPHKVYRLKGHYKAAKKVTGFRALYLHYCYLLGLYPKSRSHRPLSPEAREACRRLDHWSAQMQLIWKHHLDTPQAVDAFVSKTEAQMQLLTEHREQVRKDLARKHTTQERLVLTADREQCTRALAFLRKDRAAALSILSEQETVLEVMRAEKQMQQEKNAPNRNRRKGREHAR